MIDFFRAVPKKRSVKISSKKGLIYYNPPPHRKVIFHIGNYLFVGAVVYLAYLYQPLVMALVDYQFYSLSKEKVVETKGEEVVAVIPTPTGMMTAGQEEYLIQIPKIRAISEVVANVNPYNKSEYTKVLSKDVVAQAKNTDPPGGGLGKMTYIFAHSSQLGTSLVRNNAVFYLLGQLKNEDLIQINYQGEIFHYRVYDQKIVTANEVKYLSYSEPDKEILILQTCWPIGTDWKRLLVLAKKI